MEKWLEEHGFTRVTDVTWRRGMLTVWSIDDAWAARLGQRQYISQTPERSIECITIDVLRDLRDLIGERDELSREVERRLRDLLPDSNSAGGCWLCGG